MTEKNSKKSFKLKKQVKTGQVAQASNPIYSGDWDWEDQGLRSAQPKS
jgi:hypothetical protein